MLAHPELAGEGPKVRRESRTNTDFQVAVDQGVEVDGLRINVAQDDTDNGDPVLDTVSKPETGPTIYVGGLSGWYLALTTVIDGAARDERLGTTEGVAEHEVLEP